MAAPATVVVEYCERTSPLLHRVTVGVSVDGVGRIFDFESFVDGSWVESSDTQRGLAMFHYRKLTAFAELAAEHNVTELQVKL